MQELDAEPLLQPLHVRADRRFRQLQTLRRRREAAGLDNEGEGGDAIEAIHGDCPKFRTACQQQSG
jgi:hypothetical protein